MFPRNRIKRQILLGSVMGLGVCASSATAQLTINFDETGNGTVQNPGGVPVPLISLGNVTDPFDPGNGLQPLGYSIVGTTGVAPTDGDINLFEPQNPNV